MSAHSSTTFRSLVTLLTVAMLCMTVTLAASGSVSKATRFFNRGERALKSGDIDKARQFFEQALTELPMFPQAHLGLGNIAMAEGKYEQALKEYEAARDGYPKVGQLLLEVQTRRYADAQKNIQSLRDSIQQLRSPSNRQGDADIKISQLENTISQLEAIEPPKKEALSEAPAEVHFYIGNALFRLGKTELALVEWNRCVEKNPEFPMVYNNLAIIHMQRGDMEEARKHLLKAEELGFPVNPKFKADLGL